MGNVMVWGSSSDSWMLGVLQDGTIFQSLPGTGWKTLVGPQPTEEGLNFALAVTRAAESTGGPVDFGPVEFVLEENVLGAIRADDGWGITGPLLLDALVEALDRG
jgi:hypothetical protein